MWNIKRNSFIIAGVISLGLIGSLMNSSGGPGTLHATTSGPAVTIAGPLPLPVSGSLSLNGTPNVNVANTPSVNINGTPSVNVANSVQVGNTLQAPLSIQKADAQNAFGIDTQFSMADQVAQAPQNAITAPPGKRMVIETMTMYGFLASNSTFLAICGANYGFAGSSPTVSFPTFQASNSNPNGLSAGSVPVKIYADSLSCNINRTNPAGAASGTLTITGHYEPIQ